MRKLIPFMAVLMAVSLVFVVSACSDRNRTGETSSRMSDNEDSEKMIKDRLNSDSQLRGSNIDVSTDPDNREVKLSGKVNSEELRRKAVQIAQSALPGYTITDTIDVEPKEMARSTYGDQTGDQDRHGEGMTGGQGMSTDTQTGGSAEDTNIRSQVQSKFSNTNLFKDVRVEVNNGVVTLNGNVRSENEKREAERMARDVKGVSQVENKLQVSSSQSGSSQSQSPAR